MELGPFLRDVRHRQGLDQSTLARRAGTTQTYISRIERGDVSPSAKTVERLMHAMGLELVLDARPLSPGNVSAHDLRVDRGRSAAERVRQAMEISDFLSGVVAAGQRERDR